MELSSSTLYLVRIAQTTGEYFRRGQSDCMEGTTPAAQALHEAGRSRQGQEENHYCRCSRAVGLHLGHRHQVRNYSQAADLGMTRIKSNNGPKSENEKKDDK